MRKKTKQTGLVITGATALFVCIAGDVQAIPVSFHDTLGSQPKNNSVQNNQPAAPTPSPTAVSQNPIHNPSLEINVPDGGTTGVMVGGVFGGLVLLKKKRRLI